MQVFADPSLAALIAALEERARAATTVAELGFSIANDSYSLLGYRQALVFEGAGAQSRLLTVSGLARPTEDSPYLVWLRRIWPWLQTQLEAAPGWYVPPAAPGAEAAAQVPQNCLRECRPTSSMAGRNGGRTACTRCLCAGAVAKCWAGCVSCSTSRPPNCRCRRCKSWRKPGATAGRCSPASPSRHGKAAGST